MELEQWLSQVKVAAGCKVCRLATLDPTLYRQLHELYFRKSASLRAVCKLVNPLLLVRKVDLPPFSAPNLQTHLRGNPKKGRVAHVPVIAHVAAEITRAARSPVQARAEAAAGAIQHDVHTAAVQDQLDLYRSGVALFRELETVHVALRAQIQASSKGGAMSGQALRSLLAVVRELRGLLGELGRIQTVEKLVNAVTAVTVRELSFDYLNDLGLRLARLGLAADAEAAVRDIIGNTLAHHAKLAVQRVREGALDLKDLD
jgi:hypothetical protein